MDEHDLEEINDRLRYTRDPFFTVSTMDEGMTVENIKYAKARVDVVGGNAILKADIPVGGYLYFAFDEYDQGKDQIDFINNETRTMVLMGV